MSCYLITTYVAATPENHTCKLQICNANTFYRRTPSQTLPGKLGPSMNLLAARALFNQFVQSRSPVISCVLHVARFQEGKCQFGSIYIYICIYMSLFSTIDPCNSIGFLQSSSFCPPWVSRSELWHGLGYVILRTNWDNRPETRHRDTSFCMWKRTFSPM